MNSGYHRNIRNKCENRLCFNPGRWADEMSECTIPHTLSYGRLSNSIYKPGEVVPVTTTIKYNCELSSYDAYNSENTCKNGSWTLPDNEPVCVVCGMSELKNNSQHISPFKDYYTANRKDFPWHVGIYDKDHRVPKLICSGSIISSKFVLTFSGCFFLSKWDSFDENKFAIAAGKLYSNWNNPLDTQAQFVNIDNLLFEYKRHRVEAVVAVLKKHLHITSYVSPICLNVHEMTVNSTIYPLEEVPVWSKKQVDEEGLTFLRFPSNNQTSDVNVNSSIPCKLLKKIRIGSGVVTHLQINGENRDVLRKLVMVSFCSQKRKIMYQYNLNEHVAWLTTIIRESKS